MVRLRVPFAFAIALWGLAMVFTSGQAQAQSQCPGSPVCPAGSTYTGPDIGPRGSYGVCEARNGLNYIDHQLVPCPAGLTLDGAQGVCRPATCDGAGGGRVSICQSAPVCPADTTYTGASTGPRGTFGVCEHRSGLNYIDHQLVPCPTGFTLIQASGVCQRCPVLRPGPRPPLVLLPDLVIERSWARPVNSSAPTNTLRVGQPYYACFVVANRGAGPSGSFRVAGGGLGLPNNPYQDQAGLAAGATRQGCLSYPTTPRAGSYKLGLSVDSLNAVHESNEGNNDAVIALTFTP